MRNDRLVAIGYLGGPNIGDESISLAIATVLKEQYRVQFVSGRPDVSKQMAGDDFVFIKGFYPGRPLYPGEFWKLINAIKQSSGVLLIGGGVFQNVHSNNLLMVCAFFASASNLFDKKFVGVGVGYGPIKTKFGSWLCGISLARVSQLSFRDRNSLAQVNALGLPSSERFIMGADSAFALQPISNNRKKTQVGLCFRGWNALPNKLLWDLFHQLTLMGNEIVLLAFERSDVTFYQDVLGDTCSKNIVFPATVNAAREIIANLSGVVSMRLHACIFSAIDQVPFVAISYDDKVKDVVAEIGLELNVFSIDACAEDVLISLSTSPPPPKEAVDKLRQIAQSTMKDALGCDLISSNTFTKTESFVVLFYIYTYKVLVPTFKYYVSRILDKWRGQL